MHLHIRVSKNVEIIVSNMYKVILLMMYFADINRNIGICLCHFFNQIVILLGKTPLIFCQCVMQLYISRLKRNPPLSMQVTKIVIVNIESVQQTKKFLKIIENHIDFIEYFWITILSASILIPIICSLFVILKSSWPYHGIPR